MTIDHHLRRRLGVRLLGLAAAAVAAASLLAAQAAPAAADGRETSRGSYYATCGHLGVPCLDRKGARGQRRRACRARQSARREGSRRARRACRSRR